jgi:hypothetical protein
MSGINRLKERYKDSHPGFGSYLECMTRAFLTGLGKNYIFVLDDTLLNHSQI